MKEMKKMSPDAHKWLEGKPPSHWSKSHFSTQSKCDMLLNNLCESFNKFILNARDKPILTMMETIRTKLMQGIAIKSAKAEKYVGPLCPNIQKKKLDKVILDSVKCWAKHVDGPRYQVGFGPKND